MKDFVVAARARSAAIFNRGAHLSFNEVPTPFGLVTVTLRTRYLDKGHSVTIPGQLWADIRGSASNVQEAFVGFCNVAIFLTPYLALSANAAIDDLEGEVAYDNTPGLSERDFFQNYLPDEPDTLHVNRRINVAATAALIIAARSHSSAERIHRAASQYSVALQHWRLGRQTLALAHLWMGMEALTKAKLDVLCRERSVSKEQLAASLNLDQKGLEPAIRLQFLFQNDKECYDDARKASDGFEHGFMRLDDVSKRAQSVHHRTANYLRATILDMCGLDESTRTTLLGAPYDSPLGCWPIAKYLRGQLIGTSSDLATPQNEYPIIRWQTKIKSASLNAEGKTAMELEELMTFQLGEGITFAVGSIEAWQPD